VVNTNGENLVRRGTAGLLAGWPADREGLRFTMLDGVRAIRSNGHCSKLATLLIVIPMITTPNR